MRAPRRTRAAGAPAAELTIARRRGVLAICCCSLLLVSIDNTIVNVALPSIRTDLDATVSQLQWIVDAYTLVLAGLLMVSGATADRIGRRRTFVAGIAVFTLASAVCSVAPSPLVLIAARAAQAVGGSMLNPVAMAIITNVFVEPRERARAIGLWGSVWGVSLALGPGVGGVLTETVGWRAVFWVNIPIGIVVMVLARRYLPESRAEHPRRIDPIGQALIAFTVGLTVLGVIEGPVHGWTSPLILAAFVAAGVLLVLLVVHAARHPQPVLELRFFRNAMFTGAVLTAVLTFASFGMFMFLNTLYLQEVRGLSPARAGACLLPLAVAVLAAAPLSGRMVGRFGPRPSMVLAGTCMALGALPLTRLEADTPLPMLLATYLVFGVGAGLINSPVTYSAVSGMPREQAGVAAGLATTSRQIGNSLGVAIGGSLAGGAAATIGVSFASATHSSWWLAVGYGVAIAVLGVVTTGARARRTAHRAGAALVRG